MAPLDRFFLFFYFCHHLVSSIDPYFSLTRGTIPFLRNRYAIAIAKASIVLDHFVEITNSISKLANKLSKFNIPFSRTLVGSLQSINAY